MTYLLDFVNNDVVIYSITSNVIPKDKEICNLKINNNIEKYSVISIEYYFDYNIINNKIVIICKKENN